MATFVLVHGSRHGGWCWKRVAGLLRAAGHEVSHPTLSGVGERAHVAEHAAVNLDTHIEDVAAHLFYDDLENVILVGHSYGGMVITGVADRCADRLAHLVYFDALVPYDGEAHLDLAGELGPALRAAIAGEGRGLRLPAGCTTPQRFGVVDPADIAWVAPRLTDQPAATYQQRLSTTGTAYRLPRTYLRCRDSTMIDPAVIARAEADPDFEVVELAADHDAMITAPELLADCLSAIAGAPEGVAS
jgi:pimeloyl-ACP methyl ester carboxylesterase